MGIDNGRREATGVRPDARSLKPFFRRFYFARKYLYL